MRLVSGPAICYKISLAADAALAPGRKTEPMKIAEIIARENMFTPQETAYLMEDVRRYLAGATREQSEFEADRSAAPVSPAQLHSFFRLREREENTCRILQYLLLFLENLTAAGPEPGAVRQLAGFANYQVALLRQRDVRTAIMREYSRLGILKHANLWYYEGRIDEMHRELSADLANVREDGAAAVLALCRVLERLSLFWFDICREDPRRARASDLYAYKLARLLQRALGAQS